MKPNPLVPDLGAAEAFLALLDPTATTWTFQTFDDTKAKRDELARVLHGTLAGVAETLTRLNNLGCGIFVTVNRTDGNGRKAENVTAVRALFVDEDRPLYQDVALPPSIVVQADRGKHYYFKLVPGVRLEDFRPAQRQLAAYYRSDPTVDDLPRVMRLPGFYHRKYAPKLVTFEGGTGSVYTLADVLAAHPVETKAASSTSVTSPTSATSSTSASLPTNTKATFHADDRVAKLERIVVEAADARPWTEGSRHASGKATATHARKLGLPDDRVAAIVTSYLSRSGAEEDAPGILKWALANVAPDPDEAAPRTSTSTVTATRGALALAPTPEPEAEYEWIEVPGEDSPPPLADAAYYGLAGRIVRTIEPHSEGDPAGILLQLLVAYGSAVGRNPYYSVGAVAHHAVEFVGLVGESGAARKGTSFSEVRRLLGMTGDSWEKGRIASGLSSGEGLLWEVRDPIEKVVTSKEKKGKASDAPVTVDPGVSDKRLLCLEPELGRVLKVMQRDGSTLSGTVRELWDCPPVLRPMVRNNPYKATRPHVSIVGHVTKPELLRLFDEVDVVNGLGNRFLWAFVRRSKLLPDGGSLSDAERLPLANELREALERARRIERMTRDAEAARVWAHVYPALTADRMGIFGAVTRRAEAHVLRLSMIFALLDGAAVISRDHLRAGLAVWDYCEASARCIFGSSLGDAEADEILRALRASPAGLSRSELRDLFNRNVSAARITRALHALDRAGLAHGGTKPTNGRPEERWFYGRREVTT